MCEIFRFFNLDLRLFVVAYVIIRALFITVGHGRGLDKSVGIDFLPQQIKIFEKDLFEHGKPAVSVRERVKTDDRNLVIPR